MIPKDDSKQVCVGQKKFGTAAWAALALVLVIGGVIYYSVRPEPAWEDMAGCPGQKVQQARWDVLRDSLPKKTVRGYLTKPLDGKGL